MRQPSSNQFEVGTPSPSRLKPRNRMKKLRKCSISKKLEKKTSQPIYFPGPKLSRSFSKCDVDNGDDLLACAEYAHNIFEVNKYYEANLSPTIYMHFQHDLSAKIRCVLVDWLIEVHYQFEFQPEVLYLTCNFLDRYLMNQQVDKVKLQLVGVSSLFIAAKYVESHHPKIQDCIDITDSAYTKQDIVKMEFSILQKLHFEIGAPTSWSFLRRAHSILKSTEVQIFRTEYYSQRCLLEHDMLSYRPMIVTGACIFLSRMHDEEPSSIWPQLLEDYLNLSSASIRACVSQIIIFLNTIPCSRKGQELNALKQKFSQSRFQSVALEKIPKFPEYLPENSTFQI